MKNRLILLSILFFPFLASYSQEKPLTVSSKIKEVTVFLNGAQVTRTGSIALKAGNQQVVFENLPQAINAQSIQVSGTGDFTILSVNNQLNYLKPQQKPKEMTVLEDSLDLLQNKLKTNAAALEVLKDEENLLKANQTLGGTQTGVKVEELKAALDLYRSRLTEIKTKSIKIAIDNTKIVEEVQNIKNQLNQLQNIRNTPTSEVIVSVSSPTVCQAQLVLSYLVSNAGWMATYDVRAIDITKPIQLIYKAKVFQSTGENWKDIRMTLSTGNPVISGNAPVVYPWYLSMAEPISRMKNEADAAPEMRLEEAVVIGYGAKKAFKASTPLVQTSINQTTVEFKIDNPYTVPSDGQQYTVEVKSTSLPATFEYYCAPKLDTDVFLLAKITGWEDLNLISGETSLFFEGTYVGTAYMDTQNTKDTMNVSLGRDKSIVVTRIRQKDFTSKKLIGSTRTDTRSFEVVARNKKKQPITLMIEEQIPVSTTKEIYVESTNSSGSSPDKVTGKIVWKMQLQPSESKTFINGYTVSYPRDKSVVLE